MYNCIDSYNKTYTLEQYCLLAKQNANPKEIFCPFCQNRIYLRGKNSMYRTHFTHSNNKSCCSSSYEDLFDSKGQRKTKEEIFLLKLNIISFSYDIFTKIKATFIPNLTIKLYLDILKKVIDAKVLTLQKTTPSLIPYIWINELGSYNNTLYLFTNRYNSDKSKLWNCSTEKNVILCANFIKNNQLNHYIISIDTLFLEESPNKIPINFIYSIIPKILDIFSLDDSSSEFIIRDLLTHV